MDGLDLIDKGLLAAMVDRPGVGLSGVLRSLAIIAVGREGLATSAPEKEKWHLGYNIAADASIRAGAVGL